MNDKTVDEKVEGAGEGTDITVEHITHVDAEVYSLEELSAYAANFDVTGESVADLLATLSAGGHFADNPDGTEKVDESGDDTDIDDDDDDADDHELDEEDERRFDVCGHIIRKMQPVLSGIGQEKKVAIEAELRKIIGSL